MYYLRRIAGLAVFPSRNRFPVMRRIALLVALLAAAAACTSEPEPTPLVTPPSADPATTTTTVPTTTTTTTTPFVVNGEGVDAELTALVLSLYSIADGGPPPAASEEVIESFTRAQGVAGPRSAAGHVARLNDELRVAVVEADSDVTLVVGDPSWRVVGGWWPSLGIDAVLGEFPKIVAVVGSDARPGEDRERTRADSIHFVALDGSGSATVVGVPRDSWVSIPGAGRSKINSSLSRGGPDMMMQTFAELTGLDFDGYLLTGFAGFQDLIRVLGGLEIDVPMNLNDRWAKAYISAGRQVLDAADALAFTRVRKTIPGGDFTRQENGGRALIAAAAMLGASGPSSIPGMLESSTSMYSTDLSPEELLTLAMAITRVDQDRVTNLVVPGGIGSAGGASVVFLGDRAQEIFEDLTDGVIENS